PASSTYSAPKDAATAAASAAYASSVPQRQAIHAPLALNAPGRSSVAPGLTGSIPPAANRFAANPARAVCAATGPSVARTISGRSPLAARYASDASRSASNASAYRWRGSPPSTVDGEGSRSTAFSPRFGNSLTPVSG